MVFHRACVFSSFDQGSVPPSTQLLKTIRYAKEDKEPGKKEEGGPYWSLMLEVTCGPLKKVNKDTIGWGLFLFVMFFKFTFYHYFILRMYTKVVLLLYFTSNAA